MTKWTRFIFSRTAVSSSMAENRNPPSPEIETTLFPGRARVQAIAHGNLVAVSVLRERGLRYLADMLRAFSRHEFSCHCIASCSAARQRDKQA